MTTYVTVKISELNPTDRFSTPLTNRRGRVVIPDRTGRVGVAVDFDDGEGKTLHPGVRVVRGWDECRIPRQREEDEMTAAEQYRETLKKFRTDEFYFALGCKHDRRPGEVADELDALAEKMEPGEPEKIQAELKTEDDQGTMNSLVEAYEGINKACGLAEVADAIGISDKWGGPAYEALGALAEELMAWAEGHPDIKLPESLSEIKRRFGHAEEEAKRPESEKGDDLPW